MSQDIWGIRGALESCDPTCGPGVFLGTLRMCHLGEVARDVVSTDQGVPMCTQLGLP